MKNWMIFGLILVLLVNSNLFGQVPTKTYLPTSSLIANPERGWYNDYYSFGNNLTGSYRLLDSILLRTHRENDQVTLILRLFYLHQFLNEASVSSDYLAKMQADFNAVRTAGVKCIVRFAYSDSQSAAIWDATPEKVMSHIESLSAVLSANSDIIAGVQAGFIGAWGEWYYTKNFAGNGYVPDATDLENRRLLVEALLAIFPENIQVQVRTPAIKQNIVLSEEPIADDEAYNGSIKSRIGHHNDCFLANSSDYGTYIHLAADLAYMAQETKYAIAGGETCDASNSYSDCVNAIARMQLLHWTYLNANYNQDVYDKWGTQGCLNEVNLGLGYRIFLESATFPDSLEAGFNLVMTFNFQNVGFAAPTQYKPIQLVLKNTQTTEQLVLPFSGTNDDIRFWFPGSFTSIGHVSLPASLADGNYLLSLRFPDQSSSLASNPSYSIQLANVGLWNSALGTNSLNHIVVIGSGGEGSIPATPSSLLASVISYSQIDISWTDNATDETEVEIYRCKNENNEWEPIATVPANTITFSDEGLEQQTTYSYMVRTVNSFGKSDWSEKAVVTTLANSIHQNIENRINVYPNPYINGSLYIYAQSGSMVNISISNLTGKQLYSSLSSENPMEINDLKLEAGIYIVTIQTSSETESRKLIIK